MPIALDAGVLLRTLPPYVQQQLEEEAAELDELRSSAMFWVSPEVGSSQEDERVRAVSCSPDSAAPARPLQGVPPDVQQELQEAEELKQLRDLRSLVSSFGAEARSGFCPQLSKRCWYKLPDDTRAAYSCLDCALHRGAVRTL